MEEQCAQIPKVKLISECSVKPASPTPPEARRMYLPSIDMLWIPIKNLRRLLFYRTPPSVSLDQVVESLKESLAKVLVDFYPVAGRLALNPDTSRPEFDCNDGGVKFIVAAIDFPFGELDKDECAQRDWFGKLVPEFQKTLTAFACYPDEPLLSVQVTGFEGGGGFCIGTAMQHVVGDGKSYWHFMNSWSQLSRGQPQISAKPHHARVLFSRDPPPERRLQFQWLDVAVDGVQGGAQLGKFVPTGQRNGDGAKEELQRSSAAGVIATLYQHMRAEQPQLKRTFHVTADTIARLRRVSGARSSFVAVAAHTWRCVVAVRAGHEAEAGAGAVFVLAADCRGRVRPAAPGEYFGNCLVFGMVKVAAQTVLADLAAAARAVQCAVDWCTTEEHVWQTAEWLAYDDRNGMERLLEAAFGPPWPLPASSNVIGSPRFPLYESDFGWGPPVGVDVARLEESGCIYLAPARGARDGFEVTTLLPAQQMQTFAMLFHARSVA